MVKKRKSTLNKNDHRTESQSAEVDEHCSKDKVNNKIEDIINEGSDLQPNDTENYGGIDSNEGSDSSSSDDDSLILEGELIRNFDVSDDDDDSTNCEDEDDRDLSKKKQKGANVTIITKTKKPRKDIVEPETIQIEFLFCDMNEKFFHGIKTLLHRNSIHAPHSSELADLIIDNVSVGTVLSTHYDPNDFNPNSKQPSPLNNSHVSPSSDDDPNVFGFASIINLTTNHKSPCIRTLKALCLQYCPSPHKKEMETLLSGETKRPAGFFFHDRMVNVPLEITEVLHQQLVLDMDWAVENADGGIDVRKSLDYGAFVRLAPCSRSNGGGNTNNLIYKYFDDEVLSTNAEFVYTFDAPKSCDSDEELPLFCVIVLTKTGHRSAMKDLATMIH